MRALVLALVGLISACQWNGLAAGNDTSDKVWTLIERDGTPFMARATLTIGQDGRISGQAPCNRFSTTNLASYPRFAPGPILATRMACPDLQAESAFFKTLSAMTHAEILQDTLTLRNERGAEMVFKVFE